MLACTGWGKPLLTVTGGHLSPGLELWLGNFCPACKRVYCKECLNDWVGFQPPCRIVVRKPTRFPKI